MAHPDHLKLIKQSVEQWNTWRESHPKEVPDLSGAYLYEADLSRANLGGATTAALVERDTALKAIRRDMAQIIKAWARAIGGWLPSVRGDQWSGARCDQERIRSGAHECGDRPSSRTDRDYDRCSAVPAVR